jgi:hypothetical protein
VRRACLRYKMLYDNILIDRLIDVNVAEDGVRVPSFSGISYMKLARIRRAEKSLKIDVQLKTSDQRRSCVLRCAEGGRLR